MKVLFDVELDGQPETDSHLLDVIFTYKGKIIEVLKNYIPKIDKENGVIIISFPKNTGMDIKYYTLSESSLSLEIENILLGIDYKDLLKSINGTRNN